MVSEVSEIQRLYCEPHQERGGEKKSPPKGTWRGKMACGKKKRLKKTDLPHTERGPPSPDQRQEASDREKKELGEEGSVPQATRFSRKVAGPRGKRVVHTDRGPRRNLHRGEQGEENAIQSRRWAKKKKKKIAYTQSHRTYKGTHIRSRLKRIQTPAAGRGKKTICAKSPREQMRTVQPITSGEMKDKSLP